MGQPAMFSNSPSSLAVIGEWNGDLVLKFSCVSGDSVPQESETLQSCNGEFGIVEHFASFSIFLVLGIPANNDLILPSNAISFFSSVLMTNEGLPAPCGVM